MLLDIRHLFIDRIQQNKCIPICQDLNFSIDSGETLGVLGESGSGKSVTSLSILRLLPPALRLTSGEILFEDKNGMHTDLCHITNKEMQHIRGNEISMIFQEPLSALNPVYTCGHQVMEVACGDYSANPWYSARQKKENRENVLHLFEKVRLTDPMRIFNSYPYQLSGGQNQRVMIAMAISRNPRLLIADEPTTALDASLQRSVLELLKELQEELKMGILFITHDIGQLIGFADRILVLYHGNIVEQENTTQLMNHPVDPYTRGLMNCRTSIRKKGERLQTLSNPLLEFKPEIIPIKSAPEQPSTKIIQVEKIKVSFARPNHKNIRNIILQDIYLDVFKGETLGLVGESGSGKTTLGKVIMRLIDPQSGVILFNGKQIEHTKGKQLKNLRKHLQIVFQDPYASLNPRMTIGNALTEPLKVHQLFPDSFSRHERVMQLLEQVNLPKQAYYQYPHQFSGGQRQRIGIARALAVEPEVIILDESVSALDVSIQAQILNLLNDLKTKYKLTYIFISHDLNTVRYMADRVVVLKEGAVVESGTAECVLTSPSHPYTASLIASIPG